MRARAAIAMALMAAPHALAQAAAEPDAFLAISYLPGVDRPFEGERRLGERLDVLLAGWAHVDGTIYVCPLPAAEAVDAPALHWRRAARVAKMVAARTALPVRSGLRQCPPLTKTVEGSMPAVAVALYPAAR
ncbi:MAG: hypothetical protein ACOY45_07080 [Pseudomonadota bacterium]